MIPKEYTMCPKQKICFKKLIDLMKFACDYTLAAHRHRRAHVIVSIINYMRAAAGRLPAVIFVRPRVREPGARIIYVTAR